ncbi:MAG: hypothetical protein P1U87_18655, partial [Verrucomicrobiales bacterium]|nr:hypothetical protein [Verrucomicrobiales bacterium]
QEGATQEDAAQEGWATGLTGFEDAKQIKDLGSFKKAFDALLDDLNTPDALGQIFTAMKSIKPADLSPEEALREWRGLHFVLEALGLELPDLEAEASTEVPEEISSLAAARLAAKQAKDWGEADRLRDAIGEAGWEIKDTKEGYELCPKS